jgi:hypothetical protein
MLLLRDGSNLAAPEQPVIPLNENEITMHNWIVKLSGNDGDIKELADCLVDPSVSISKAATNDAYILSSPDFRKLENVEKVVELARELITSILGMSHLYGIDCMNIDVESVYKQCSDGSGESTQLFNGKVRIINRSADQFSISDAELLDKSVSGVLRILSKGDLNSDFSRAVGSP